MLVLDSFPPSVKTCFASGEGVRAVSPRHMPRQNNLLAALPVEDYARLLPNLEPVSLPLGSIVYSAGKRENYLYFLTEGIVTRFYVTASGASAESAVTGSEGAIGIASFLGAGSTPSQAMVIVEGYAHRVRTELLKDDFDHDGPLLHLLLRYALALIAQTAQIVACNRHHTLEQKVCRWLLSCLDRVSSGTLTITHELLANLLGVRREGVTAAAGDLRLAGLIQYRRGHITVLDRRGLEARVCECYAVVKREYERLLPPEDFIKLWGTGHGLVA